MRVLSFDPSGNHPTEGEGSGTTGMAKEVDGVITLHEIKASDFETTEEYWAYIRNGIEKIFPDYVVVEGYRLYNHKGQGAEKQANSTLQTSQLIGVIRMVCHDYKIPLTIQFASDVKTRWSEKVLQHTGFLDEKNRFNGKQTNAHKRDALKHLLHFKKYKLPKLKGEV